MKKYLPFLLLTALGLKAEIQFAGISVIATDARFVLVDTENSSASSWLKIGESFDGYTLTSFDRTRDVIILRHDGKSLEIPLRQSKTKKGTITLLPPLETIKGLIGLEEAITRFGRDVVEKRLLFEINHQPEEKRAQSLADLMSGKQKHIFTPKDGYTDAFVKKYGLTPEEVATGNLAIEIGKEREPEEKAAEKSRPSSRP